MSGHATFRAIEVDRFGAFGWLFISLRVLRGAFITDDDLGFDKQWDPYPTFRCGVGDFLLLVGPSIEHDHAGAYVEKSDDEIVARITMGSLSKLTHVVRLMTAAQARRMRAKSEKQREKAAKRASKEAA